MANWESRVYCSETYTSGGAENYSNVTIYFQIRRTDYNMIGHNNTGSAYWSISCDGQSSGNKYFNFDWGSNAKNSWWTVGSHTFKVYHNSDGAKSISFSGYYYTGISPSSFSANNSATLTKIARYANITQFDLINPTQTSFDIKWNTDAGCDSVAWAFDGGQWTYTSGLTIPITGLNPGQTYKVKISIKRTDSQLWTTSSLKSITTVPIASISNSPSCKIGGTLNLKFANEDNNKYFIRLYQKNTSGTFQLIDSKTDIQADSYDWNLSSFASTMYANTPNSNTSVGKIVCGTTINSKEYKNEVACTFSVENSNPTFSNFQLSNTDITSGTNLFGSADAASNMITYFGNLRITVPTSMKAIALNSATIKEYKVSITAPGSNPESKIIKEGSGDVYVDYGTFYNSGIAKVSVTAVDSRGNQSSTITKSITIYEYNTPTISISMERVNKYEKETGLIVVGHISRVNNKNSLQEFKYRYKKQNGSWSAYTAVSLQSATSGNDYVLTYSNGQFIVLDTQSSFDFEFIFSDKIRSISYSLSIGQGIPLFTISESGVVLVGEIPNEESLSSTVKMIVNSDIAVRDVNGIKRNVLDEINKKITFTESESIEPTDTLDGTIWCPIIATINLS